MKMHVEIWYCYICNVKYHMVLIFEVLLVKFVRTLRIQLCMVWYVMLLLLFVDHRVQRETTPSLATMKTGQLVVKGRKIGRWEQVLDRSGRSRLPPLCFEMPLKRALQPGLPLHHLSATPGALARTVHTSIGQYIRSISN